MNSLLPFDNRRIAGRLLGQRLAHLRHEHPIVLALLHGGVPVAYEIADALDARLDLLIVRKISAPGHPELSIGAVIDGDEPQLVLEEKAMRIAAPNSDYIQRETGRQLVELERRRRAYRGITHNQSLAEKTIIIVVDGIGNGATVGAAVRAARRKQPARIILAVPVALAAVIDQLRPLCDEIVVLATPRHFVDIGEHYRDFHVVEDGEGVELLAAAAGRSREMP